MPVSQVFCRVELAFFTTALTPKSWNLPWNTRPATACAWHCLRARWHSRATLATGDLPAYSSTPWKKFAVEKFCRSTLLFFYFFSFARAGGLLVILGEAGTQYASLGLEKNSPLLSLETFKC
jgi:hypothetical protein